jgi:hypothetical protein
VPNSYIVLNDKISFSVLLWFLVTKKIAAYESEISFDLNIPDIGDFAISHAIPRILFPRGPFPRGNYISSSRVSPNLISASHVSSSIISSSHVSPNIISPSHVSLNRIFPSHVFPSRVNAAYEPLLGNGGLIEFFFSSFLHPQVWKV